MKAGQDYACRKRDCERWIRGMAASVARPVDCHIPLFVRPMPVSTSMSVPKQAT